MTNKHTSGPWYHGNLNGNFYVCKDVGNLFYDIARVDNWPEETEANARLIASAPELLAALETVVRMIGPYAGQGRMDTEISAARAAIAKARGE